MVWFDGTFTIVNIWNSTKNDKLSIMKQVKTLYQAVFAFNIYIINYLLLPNTYIC